MASQCKYHFIKKIPATSDFFLQCIAHGWVVLWARQSWSSSLPSLLRKLEQTSNLRAIRLVYEFDWSIQHFKRTKAKKNTNMVLNSKHAQTERRSNVFAFSFPDSTLPLVSTKSRDSWSWSEGTRPLGKTMDVRCGFACAVTMGRNNGQKQVAQTS